jgi:hypothetical protein
MPTPASRDIGHAIVTIVSLPEVGITVQIHVVKENPIYVHEY